MFREYADGILYGNSYRVLYQPPLERALNLGRSEGCPIAPDLVKEKGADVMSRRYAPLIFWRGYIKEILKKTGNREMFRRIFSDHPRRDGEFLGINTPDWLPESAIKNVKVTVASYALPRLICDAIRNQPHNMPKILECFDESVASLEKSTTTSRFMVNFGEKLYQITNSPIVILQRLLSVNKLREDNQLSTFNTILQLVKDSPILGPLYHDLTSRQRDELGIYNPFISEN